MITDFVASLLRFSMPTHTHNFDNHRNGYGCLKNTARAELADYRKTASSMIWDSKMVSEHGKYYDF